MFRGLTRIASGLRPARAASSCVTARPAASAVLRSASTRFSSTIAAPAPFARIRRPAPDFKATAVVGSDFKDVSLSDYKGKYVVLLFYPLAYTFVCPTEIVSFADKVEEFRKLGAEVLAISVDSKFTQLAWLNTPRKEGGIQGVKIPMVADLNHKIHEAYGVLEDDGFGTRGLFIIDPKGVLRIAVYHDRPVGRSVDEALRALTALIYTDKHGDEVCPSGWTPGQPTIRADPVKKNEYFEKVNKK